MKQYPRQFRGGAGSAGVSRRRLLKAAGAAAAAAPFLRGGIARAAGSPMRLVCWPMMNGADAGAFYPGGNATALSLITEPLRKYASLVTFIKGVNIAGSTNHYAVRSTYSGFPIADYSSPDPTVKSVDQLIADSIEASPTPTTLKSLHLGVIPADTINYYQRVGRNTFFFAPRPVDYEANPVTAFDRLFLGAPASNGPTAGSPDYSRDVLSVVGAEMKELTAELGGNATSELAKLKQHEDAWSVCAPKPAMPMSPMSPAMSMAAPLPTVEKLRPMLEGNPRDAYKQQYFSDMFDAQLDNMARALVSGLTRVATLQAGSADNNVIVPVGPGYPHHLTSHGDQNTYNQLQKWYFGKLARFAGLLDVPDPLDPGGKTVLQNTVIVVLAECLPVGPRQHGVPALLLGTAGGKIKPGLVNGNGITNKVLMATILNVFGVAPAHFGSTTISEIRS